MLYNYAVVPKSPGCRRKQHFTSGSRRNKAEVRRSGRVVFYPSFHRIRFSLSEFNFCIIDTEMQNMDR